MKQNKDKVPIIKLLPDVSLDIIPPTMDFICGTCGKKLDLIYQESTDSILIKVCDSCDTVKQIIAIFNNR